MENETSESAGRSAVPTLTHGLCHSGDCRNPLRPSGVEKVLSSRYRHALGPE